MRKIIKIFLCIFVLSLFVPNITFGLSDSYKDIVSEDVGVKVEEDKINIYLFYGDGCPHCKAEKELLEKLEDKYPNQLNVYLYEVWDNKDNAKILRKFKKEFNLTENDSVPFTVIGEKYFYGYSDSVGVKIEKQITLYLDLEEIEEDETIVEKSKVKLPLLGEVNSSEVTIGVVAIVLGFVDGFNPCAMWILLFLINMLFGMKDKKNVYTWICILIHISFLLLFINVGDKYCSWIYIY